MSEQEQDRQNERQQNAPPEKKESTFGGVHSCLSYDRYVRWLEKKKKKCNKGCKKLVLGVGIALILAAVAIGVWLIFF